MYFCALKNRCINDSVSDLHRLQNGVFFILHLYRYSFMPRFCVMTYTEATAVWCLLYIYRVFYLLLSNQNFHTG